MIFIKIQTEKLVQVEDKTRIDLSGVFLTPNSSPIAKYEIEPEAAAGYIDLGTTNYLDWSYETPGTKTISVRITQDDTTETTKTIDLLIISAEDDNLFSGDQDIVPLESDILRWVMKGRNSFLDKHREAQIYILNDLDSNRIWKDNGDRYVAADIVDIEEFRSWSKYETLRIIFEGISNDIGDIFSEKAAKYRGFAVEAKKRANFRLDTNNDGSIDSGDQVVDNTSIEFRRG